MEEQWEFEYERIFGEEHSPEDSKMAFHAGWDAALTAILERFNASIQ